MATLLISYDLRAPGRNYDELYEYIKGLGAWWHNLESTWLVVTTLSPVAVRDGFKTVTDANDKVLVVDVSSDSAAWKGFQTSGSEWLKNNL